LDSADDIKAQLADLASYLGARREAILRAWRKAIDRDPDMNTGASLPRAQLNDHIPGLLDTFEKALRDGSDAATDPLKEDVAGDASAHGLQRWQQGYDVREVTREWGRLQLCVADELERYASSHPDVDPAVMSTARRVWAELCTDGASDSVAKYFQLQQIEATGQVRDLSRALEQLRELELSRAEQWRQAAHDLRGNVGTVMTATAGLAMPNAAAEAREKFLGILQKNVASLYSLLEDVMDLARLQAGQEYRDVKAFDAAVVLKELCERMQPVAAERGLFLKTDGPDTLSVEGDAVKAQRIGQNLLLNALKYTVRGGVTVSWGDSRQNDADRWMLCVTDTGPGFHAGPGAPIAAALEEATEESRHVDQVAKSGLDQAADDTRQSKAADARPVNQEGGEGIGLSIVKRLCELLDASIELDSTLGEGTTVRIVFPRSYGPA
jgi:signal transduction histidine kinase